MNIGFHSRIYFTEVCKKSETVTHQTLAVDPDVNHPVVDPDDYKHLGCR